MNLKSPSLALLIGFAISQTVLGQSTAPVAAPEAATQQSKQQPHKKHHKKLAERNVSGAQPPGRTPPPSTTPQLLPATPTPANAPSETPPK